MISNLLCVTRYDAVFLHQLIVAFLVIGVQWDAVDRTNLPTLGLVIVTNTLCAEAGINLIDLIAGRDCAIGALWITDITVNAVVSND